MGSQQAICKGGPKLTHVLFVYGSLLCIAMPCNNQRSVRKFKKIIEGIWRWSFRKKKYIYINHETWHDYPIFQQNTKHEMKEVIKDNWDVQASKTTMERYLGLPSLVGKVKTKKNKTFQRKKKWYGKEFQRWKEKILSNGGRQIPIKAVGR